MLTLSLDTSTDNISLALMQDDKIIAVRDETMPRGQGEALLPMIQDILKENQLSPADIDVVAVAVGPGSFTGVRIGLATARGIGLALDKPVKGVTTLQAAAGATVGEVMAVIDTKRGDFFTQRFKDGCATEEPVIRSAEELKALVPFRACGPAAGFVAEETGCEVISVTDPSAVWVARLSKTKAVAPDPLYLRDADVSC